MINTTHGTCSRPFEANCSDLETLIGLLSRFNSDFVSGLDRHTLFDRLLAGVMSHTESTYGFVSERIEGTENAILLKIHGMRMPVDQGGAQLKEDSEQLVEIPEDSMVGSLFHTGTPVISNEPATDPRIACELPGNPQLTNLLCVPLRINDRATGLIAIGNREGGYDRAMAIHLAPLVNSMAALLQAERKSESAYFDSLTGLPNQKMFKERLIIEASRHTRRRQPLSMLYMDIDHFANYRNNRGPLATEACLKRVAEVIKDNLRTEDYLVRLNDNHFAALLADTPGVRAVVVAEKLRQAVANQQIEIEKLGITISPSVSIGLATLTADGKPLDSFRHAAETALKTAHEHGGNQVQASK